MGEGSVQLLFLMPGSSIDFYFWMVYPMNQCGILFTTSRKREISRLASGDITRHIKTVWYTNRKTKFSILLKSI